MLLLNSVPALSSEKTKGGSHMTINQQSSVHLLAYLLSSGGISLLETEPCFIGNSFKVNT